MKVLDAVRNEYDGMIVSADGLPTSPEAFAGCLAASIDEWTRAGIKAIWLKIPAARSELIGEAVKLGYEFRLWRDDEVTMPGRLVGDARLPQFATRTIGVGAVVLSEQRELLTVLERNDVVSRPSNWKLPGGLLERGEHLADGVIREVFEETGVRTEFQGLLSFRHHHRGQFGASNIYAVCRLKPLSREIAIDGNEIGQAMWVPVDEYLAREGIGLYNRRVVTAALSAPTLVSIKIDGYMDGPDDYEIYLSESAV